MEWALYLLAAEIPTEQWLPRAIALGIEALDEPSLDTVYPAMMLPMSTRSREAWHRVVAAITESDVYEPSHQSRKRPRRTAGLNDALNRAIAEFGLTVEDKRGSGGTLRILAAEADLEGFVNGPLAELGPWAFSETRKWSGYWTRWQEGLSATQLDMGD